MFETVELNLIPKGEPPIVHVSQYDVGRIIRFHITNDGETIDFFGTIREIKITIRKVDSNLIVYEAFPELVADKVELVTNEQITACAGNNIGEITIVFNNPPTTGDDDASISTLNFIMNVEKSPECGGIESQSEIANLDNQIAGIVDEQLDNYYTKSEIDTQIETIVTEQVTPIVAGIVEEQVPPAVEAELSNYYDKDEIDTYFYTKSETDTLLSGKANTSDLPDMTNYYNKSETDTLLAGKVSNSTLNDYYTKTQVYNKTEVDSLISQATTDITTLIDTPAAIQTFNDGGDSIPMKSCEVDIVAQQASGTPSPTNPLPITGFSSIALSVSDGVIPTTTNVSLGQTIYGGTAELVGGNGTKTFNISDLGDLSWSYDSTNKRFVALLTGAKLNGSSRAHTNPNSKCSNYEVIFTDREYTYNEMISGISSKNNVIWLYTASGDSYVNIKDTVYTDAPTFKTAMTGIKFVYELETPTTFTFTGANIPTLSGTNNVYTDSGDIISLEYFNNKGDDIASMIRLITR